MNDPARICARHLERIPPRRDSVLVGAAFAVVAAVSAGQTQHARPYSRYTSAAADALAAAAPAPPHFRLGDAAKPFGWSTIIGDFNTDGRPDVAVADHVGRRTGRYAYRVEFLVSGQRPHDVTFESVHEAVTVRLADVDRDDDLDLVVGVPLSDETIGVWLNDGHGHFTAGAGTRAPSTIGPIESIETGDPGLTFIASEWSPRCSDPLPPPILRAPPALDWQRFARVRASTPLSPRLSAQTRPRPPPATNVASRS